jgi:cardiolipin synthase
MTPFDYGNSGLSGRDAIGEREWTHGNKVDPLIEYGEWLPRLYVDLWKAQQTIDIVEYNWEPTGVGSAVTELLKRKTAAGIEVNVMIDGYGSLGKDSRVPKERAQAWVDDMRAAGINVQVNDPGFHINPLNMHLDHRKIFVVDDKVAYTGGLGLANSGDKYAMWHDLMVRMEGPVAAQTAAEFIGSWVDGGGTVTQRQHDLILNTMRNPIVSGNGTVRGLPNEIEGRKDATDDFYHQASIAQDRFWVETPYIGDPKIAEALKQTAQRGVDVVVIVPSPESHTNGPFLRVSRSYYKDLIAAGVRVYEYPRMLHAKVWISDDRLTMGSTNLSHGSFATYDEYSVAIRDAAASAKMAGMIDADTHVATRLSADDPSLNDWQNQATTAIRNLINFQF